MARFKSRFEVVLRVRDQAEKRAQKDVADALEALRVLIHEKARVIQGRSASFQRREELPTVQGPINRFQIEDSYIEGSKIRIQQLDYKIHRAEKRYLKALSIFQERQKERKMIDKLIEKEKSEFKKQKSREEQREIADIVTMRRGRE